jgi:putative addiction module component (TIGR02574 family)
MVLMSREVTELLKKALELPVTDRADLTGSLIESLDHAKDESVEAAWETEIVRRMEDLDSGRVSQFVTTKFSADSLPQSNKRQAGLGASRSRP